MKAILLALMLASCAALAPKHTTAPNQDPACAPFANTSAQRLADAYVARVGIECADYDYPEQCPRFAPLTADFERMLEAWKGCQ